RHAVRPVMSSTALRIAILLALATVVALWLAITAPGLATPGEGPAAAASPLPAAPVAGPGDDTSGRPGPAETREPMDQPVAADAVALALIRADTFAAVPGATIWYWCVSGGPTDARDLDALVRASAVEGHLSSALQLRADSRGHAQIPRADQRLAVVV